MIDPELLDELVAERRHERQAILDLGLIADLADLDAAGRVLLRFGAALEAGDLVWICGTEDSPEIQVRVEEDGVRRWGAITGLQRPCPVNTLN